MKKVQPPTVNDTEATKTQNYPTIIQQVIPKKPLSKEELQKFEEMYQAGKIEFRLLPKMLKEQPSIAKVHIEKNPLGLKDLSPKLRDDDTLVLEAVKRNRMALQYASNRLKGNLVIVSASKEQNIEALAFASMTLSSIEWLTDVEKNNLINKLKSKDANFNLTDLPPILRDHADLVLAAIEKDGLAIQHASERLKNDPAMLRACKNSTIHALEFVSDKINLDQVYTKAEKAKLVKDIENGTIRIQSKGKLLPRIFLEDREVILACVRFDGLNLKVVPQKFQEEIEIIKASRNQNFMALDYVSNKIKLDDILTIQEKHKFIDSLKNGEITLDTLPKLLKNDPDIVLAAVQKDGLALEFAPENLQSDLKIVLEAKKQNFQALNYASEQLKVKDVLTLEEKTKMLESLKKGDLTLDAVPKFCRNDAEMVLSAIEKDPFSVKFASKSLRSNYDIAHKVLQKNGLALQYLNLDPDSFQYRGYIKAATDQNIFAVQFIINTSYIMEDYNFISRYLEKDITTIKYFPNLTGRALSDNYILISDGIYYKKIGLKDLPLRLRNDERLVESAVASNGLDLEYASPSLQNNTRIIYLAITQNIEALKYVPKDIDFFSLLEEVKPLILKGLAEGKLNFQSLPDQFKKDKEIVLEALKKDASIFKSLSEELRGDFTIVSEAMKKDITNLNFIHYENFNKIGYDQKLAFKAMIVTEKKSIIKAIKEGKLNFQSLPSFDEEIVVEAIKHDSTNLNYVLNFLVKEPRRESRKQPKALIKAVLDVFLSHSAKGLVTLENQVDAFILSEKFALSKINDLIKEQLVKSFEEDPQNIIKAWVAQSLSMESDPLEELIFEFLSYHSKETYLKTTPKSLQKRFFEKSEELVKIYSPFAPLNIAFCYQWGFGTPVDKKKAFEIIREAAEKGSFSAQIMLATAYKNGDGVVKHEISSFKIYKRLADKGSATAQYLLGMSYKKGIGVEPNPVDSLNVLGQSTKQSNPHALYELGMSYQEGVGVVKDLKMAFECFEKAAVYGNAEHQLQLAQCYLNGTGVQKNDEKAFTLLKKSADQENPLAQNLLANCYEKGIGVKENKEQASEMYLKSARNYNSKDSKEIPLIIKNLQDAIRLGNVEAKVDLGIMYENGHIDNKVDFKKAMELYTEAAAQGVKKANIQLGRIHEFGIGVPKDVKKSIEYYMQGGELSVEIEVRIGNHYALGTGVEIDKGKAYNFWLLAGYHGEVSGLTAAACYLYNGVGVKKDEEAALKLFNSPILKDYGTAILSLGSINETKNNIQEAVKHYLKAGDLFAEGKNGTAKSLSNAVECYEKALDWGCLDRKVELGLLYEELAKVDDTIDLERVFELYSDAANASYGDITIASENLARCYENGIGTDKDLKKAIEFYSKAATNYDKIPDADNRNKAKQLKEKVANLLLELSAVKK